MPTRQIRLHRKASAMTFVVAAQAVVAMLFLGDFVTDLGGEGLNAHLLIEGAAAIALLVAVVAGAAQVRGLIDQARRDDLAVALSRRAVADLVRQRFAEWRLTGAEADVALFAVKGCDAAEIARLRGAAPGTVRAQLTRIYAKAGVGSQSALLALFLDELIDPAMIAGGEETANADA
nr:helix-turn-helix transcriptional regulator [Sphingomonas changnyeongensis]